jgi:hypothetical protein
MEDNKKILLSVAIEATEALKTLAKTKIEIDALRAEQKKLDKSTEDGRAKFEAYEAEIKILNRTAQAYQKEISNNVKMQRAEEGSLEQLKAKLSLQTAAYDKMGTAAKKTAAGKELQQSILETTNELKKQEKALGDNHREVGNYAIAGKSLRAELKEMTAVLAQMKLEGKDTTAEYSTMVQKLGQMRDAMDDVQRETGGLASDTRNLDTATESLGALTGAFGTYSAIVGMSTEATDEYAEVMKNMQISMTALISLKAIGNAIQKESNTYRLASNLLTKIGISQTVKAAAAEAAWNTVKSAGTIGAKAAALAQWAWNAALAANPVVLVALAVAGLVVGVWALVKAFDSSADATENAKKADEAYEQQVIKTQQTIDRIESSRNAQLARKLTATREEILELQKNGASTETIAKKELQLAKQAANIEIKKSNEIIAANKKSLISTENNIIAQQALLLTQKKNSDEYKETKTKIDELIKSRIQLINTINSEYDSAKNKLLDITEAENKINEQADEKRKERAQKNAKAEVDIQNVKSQTIIDKQNKIADNEKKSYSERLAALTISESEQIIVIKRNRDLELKNKELTESERKAITEKAAYDIAKIKTDTEKTITDIEAKELDKRLKKEADALEAKKQQLANKQAADLEDLSKEYANSLKKAKYASDVVAIQEKYEKDKLSISQKYREQDFNESIAAMQAQLDLLPADATARIEIEKAIADAKSKYAKESADIAIKANEDVAKNAEESVKKQIELEQQLKDKKQELYAQLQTTIQDITNGVFERKNQELDEETQSISDNYDKQIAAAEGNDAKQKRLEADKQKRLEEQEKQKRKLIREQAIVERAFQAFSIGVNTAKSVGAIQANAAVLASNPITLPAVPLALAQIPIVIGTGALQLASVMAAPLPKAQYGKVFKGRSHAQGGIPVEVEGDEIILTKGVYRDPFLRQLASMINQAGGGIPLAASAGNSFLATGGVLSSAKFQNDGGYTYRNANKTDGDLTKKDIEDFKQAIKELKIYATIEDIRRADKNYVNIEDRSNI